ncbi:MAG TPA: hypothetical protein DCF61_11485 [Alphaproteobacteria bacterium]|nr:hypothetical protein [Alphaproteobacteria bacterium]HAM48068.1 hypothetical protein [Alphaproteobacteria bacterium]HCO90118.1 hypothetical protein [Alphaproteobacteria bacterium]
MEEAVKFDFETLDPDEKLHMPASAPKRKTRYSEAEIDALKQEAFAAGEAAGKQAALSHAEQIAAQALNELSANYGALLNQVDQEIANLQAAAADLGLAAAHQLAPALMAREPLAEIEALFRECAANLRNEPRIVIRIPQELVAPLTERIDEIGRQIGYPGRIVVLGEPEFTATECQMEWPDGGVTRGTPAQTREIETIITSYINGSGAEPAASEQTDIGNDFSQMATESSDQ